MVIYEKELVCKPCQYLSPLFGIGCALGLEQGKDEFAQTVPMSAVISDKKCRWKRL